MQLDCTVLVNYFIYTGKLLQVRVNIECFFKIILRRMSHFKIKNVSAGVVLYLSSQIAWNISPYFVHFLLLVKSRLTCIILIITRIKVQASNSKEEISLQLTVLFIIFIYFDCLTDKQEKKVLNNFMLIYIFL